MAKEAHVIEKPRLSAAPSTPSSGWTKHYFDTGLDCFVFYDPTRSKWLSDQIVAIEVDRVGAIAAGSSLRTGSGIPTSTTPILIHRDMCLVGIVASTSALERFVIRVDDISAGSNTQTAINYQAAGPASTQNFIDLTLNANYNANDRLDVYILSSATGNISDPRVKLLFRYRK